MRRHSATLLYFNFDYDGAYSPPKMRGKAVNSFSKLETLKLMDVPDSDGFIKWLTKAKFPQLTSFDDPGSFEVRRAIEKKAPKLEKLPDESDYEY